MVSTATAFQTLGSADLLAANPILFETNALKTTSKVKVDDSQLLLSKLAAVKVAELRFPNLNYSFEAPVVGLLAGPTPSSKVIKLGIAEESTLELLLPSNQDGVEGDVILENTSPTAYTAFMLTTLLLMLALDGELELRLTPGDFSTHYSVSTPLSYLGVISPLRKTAYELMVIEQAYGMNFPIAAPHNYVSPALVTFIHHAITKKEFVWQFYQQAFSFRAIEAAKSLLPDISLPLPRHFLGNNFPVELQGKRLDLGQHYIKIENAIITNANQIIRELEQLDGHDFQVFVRAPNGAATFQFLQTPPAPSSFDQLTQEFIAMGGQLMDLLFEAVNQLAAASLAGLTEEEKAAVTEPFILGEEAFLEPEEEN